MLDDDAKQKRATSPLRVFDVKNEKRARCAPRCAEDRRVALRRMRRALRAGLRLPRLVRRRRTRSTRRSCAGSTTTRARRSSSSARTRASRHRRSAAAAATTISSRRSAARRRPGSASARASSGCCSPSSSKASPPKSEPLDVFLVLEAPEHRDELLAEMTELRARGVSVDTDYAGRSMKGQLTYAQKRAAAVAIRGADGWTLRRRGEAGPKRRELEGGAVSSWRDTTCGFAPRRRCRQARDRRRLGGHPPRPRRPRFRRPSRRHRQVVQLVVNPERAPDAATVAHEIRNEFVLQAAARCVRARPTP